MVEKLLNAIKEKDHLAAAACFEDDRNASYTDYCPSCVGFDSIFVYGKTSAEIFFRDKFYNNSFYIAEEEIEDDRNATFFGCYNGKFCFCRMTIEEITSEGLIRKAVVRPV
ncbi:MAG: hypothetical protein IIZ51_06080 [Lachnospiraceae bacterium]|nr:hypothetical protein [Lachnospiraceae bacterium]MBQ1400570.1 hypothetical protein [Lachnospiraceae bacterium]MBQ1515401.1 hypothetical protein [Lachnospiraceae bacterium]